MREVHFVPVLTLDLLAESLPPPSVMKIDVEGSEIATLRGASTLLRQSQPILLIEIWAENSEEAAGLLGSYGYELYDLDSQLRPRQPLREPTYNTLAWPRTRPVPANVDIHFGTEGPAVVNYLPGSSYGLTAID